MRRLYSLFYCFLAPQDSKVTLNSTGTCINNTSVMMFKKGSFEIGATVYPVAIKVRVSLWDMSF